MEKEASLLKILSDVTRLKLLSLLLENGETCVCVLAQALNEQDFKISRHLGVMRQAGMIEARRDGTWMYYKLVEPRSRFEKLLHDFLRQSLADHPTMKESLGRLSKAACLKGAQQKVGNSPVAVRSGMRRGVSKHKEA